MGGLDPFIWVWFIWEFKSPSSLRTQHITSQKTLARIYYI